MLLAARLLAYLKGEDDEPPPGLLDELGMMAESNPHELASDNQLNTLFARRLANKWSSSTLLASSLRELPPGMRQLLLETRHTARGEIGRATTRIAKEIVLSEEDRVPLTLGQLRRAYKLSRAANLTVPTTYLALSFAHLDDHLASAHLYKYIGATGHLVKRGLKLCNFSTLQQAVCGTANPHLSQPYTLTIVVPLLSLEPSIYLSPLEQHSLVFVWEMSLVDRFDAAPGMQAKYRSILPSSVGTTWVNRRLGGEGAPMGGTALVSADNFRAAACASLRRAAGARLLDLIMNAALVCHLVSPNLVIISPPPVISSHFSHTSLSLRMLGDSTGSALIQSLGAKSGAWLVGFQPGQMMLRQQHGGDIRETTFDTADLTEASIAHLSALLSFALQ